MATLREDLSVLINRHSAENASNTPDFILALYLERCLAAFDGAVMQRDAWYGRSPSPIKATKTKRAPVAPSSGGGYCGADLPG